MSAFAKLPGLLIYKCSWSQKVPHEIDEMVELECILVSAIFIEKEGL